MESPFHISVNIMAADDLITHTRISTPLVLAYFTRNIPVSSPERLISISSIAMFSLIIVQSLIDIMYAVFRIMYLSGSYHGIYSLSNC